MEGRLQQIVEKNPLGGIGYFSYAYDFQGNEVFRRERIKPQSGSTEDVLTVLTTYDHAGRVVKEETTFNDSKPVVVNFEYDELGRLVGKDANSITSSYAYNLQGWLTRSSGHYYSSQLKYYDSSNPSYTGNISEWKWGNRSYRFEYDNLGRISDAHYYEGNTLCDDYSEKDISYDLNGNIRSLTRYDAGVPETLDYTYTNGILKAVGNKSIVYDGCGNITFNGRNNLEIDYNFLNLPMRIHSTDGQSVVNYRYLADGSKFSATDDTGEGLIYIGSLVYRFRNGAYELDHAAFSQGFFRKNHLSESKKYVPVYYVCDHLGSPRSLIDHTGELMVLRNYYPFGKTWRRSTEPVYYDYYHFNGKEQQTVGDAGLLDYGARFYDPDIARWLTQDPQADETFNVSPYTYCANNPIKYIDPNGERIIVHDPTNNNREYEWKQVAGKWGFYDSDNQIYEGNDPFILSVISALTYLMYGPDESSMSGGHGSGGGPGGPGTFGYNFIKGLADRSETVEIVRHYETNKFVPGENAGIWWVPFVVKPKIPTTNGVEDNIPAIALAHELAHAEDYFNGTMKKNKVWISKQYLEQNNYKFDDHIYDREKYATHIENKIRAQYGLPLRTHYAVSTDGVPIECTAILNHRSESIFYGKYKYLNN